MKRQVRHAYNRKAVDSDYSHPIGHSLTVPDHTMSIREIITRYGQGRGINASVKIPVFNGEDVEFPDLKKMDLVDISTMVENARENRAMLEHQLNEEKRIQRELEQVENEKRKQQEDDRLLKLYEERLRKQQQQ